MSQKPRFLQDSLFHIRETLPESKHNIPPERSQTLAFMVQVWYPSKDMGNHRQRQAGGNSHLHK